MKFLCIECDEPMSLFETGAPESGSLAVKFECPKCLHQIAMLTNPYETQVVSSLGVRIGKPAEASDGAAATAECPFPAMATEAQAREGTAPQAVELTWSAAARQRLDSIPEFVRPMAVSGIEKYARDKGLEHIDEKTLDDAREFFGM